MRKQKAMVIITENTVATNAIFFPNMPKAVIAVNNDYYTNLCLYLSASGRALSLMNKGIVTKQEYDKFDTIMTKKYGISSCSIFRAECLINSLVRGNMSSDKEAKKR